MLRIAGAAAVALLAITASVLGRAPNWLPLVYLVLGLASVALYWFDKRAAQANRRRIRERSLHTIDLIGGIAGGLIAQQLLRHKTSKRSFAIATLLIALLHIAGLTALLILGT